MRWVWLVVGGQHQIQLGREAGSRSREWGFSASTLLAFGAGQFLDMEPSWAPQDVWKDV